MTDVTRDYGDLMEETAAAPMAAETNGAADPGDADMSSAEITGVGQFAQNSVGHEVRGQVGCETVEPQALSN